MPVSMEILTKVAMLDRMIVMHDDLERALDGIEDCVNKSIAYRESVSCTLRGYAGSGKTVASQIVLKKMPRYLRQDKDCERTIVPAFYAEIPADAHIKSVAASLLEKLGDPYPDIGNTTQLTQRLIKLLKQCETKLVLLDEFHHLIKVSAKKSNVNESVCNWLKLIVNETKVCFCLIGQPEFRDAFLSLGQKPWDQMAKRFQIDFLLKMLCIETGSLGAFLDAVSENMVTALSLDSAPNLSNEKMQLRMFTATGGNPNYILSLVKEAACIALSEGNVVNESHFEKAWDRGVTATVCLTGDVNPFKADFGVLSSQFMRKAA